MERKQKLIYALGGFALGVLVTAAVWYWSGKNVPDATAQTTPPESTTIPSSAQPEESAQLRESETASSSVAPTPSETQADTWDSAAVYLGGDTVSYQGRRYRAKWWTQGETPGTSDVWEDLGIVDGEPVRPQGVDNVPIDASEPQNTELTDFKVVGYYPSWKPDKLQSVDFGVVTHVCYAFAIPTAEGGLRDLENPETAKTLIRSAHENGAKVLLSVGGWSYNDTPLEGVFLEATSTGAGTEKLARSILDICETYGFDGVDFINVMAYDGGDGERHSSYEFAVDCGTYWKDTRGLPAYKVVLGVPFYARPSWADYGAILAMAPDAGSSDHTAYNGMEVYYNGLDTITEKTRYARENLGGIMIWELTQDTADPDRSLLQAIGRAVE